MNNIVKSVVFAAVVLFAGIAAMQVIYKNTPEAAVNPAVSTDVYDDCLEEAMRKADEDGMSKCESAFRKFKSLKGLQ